MSENAPHPGTEQNHTVPSVIAVKQHPLHPMMVVYPVAFLSTVVVSDVLYVLLTDLFWARVSFLLTLVGFVVGVAAAAVGLAEFLLIREIRRHLSAWSHAIAAVMVLALAGVNLMMRWVNPAEAVWPWGLIASSALCAMVMVAGWLGGTLSFKYGVGVYGREDSEEPRRGGPKG